MSAILNGVGYYASSLDHNTKFRYADGDHQGRAEAEAKAKDHGEKIAADREAKAGRPLTRQEQMYGLGYENVARDEWQPVRRSKDKYDAVLEQLNNEPDTENIGQLMAMSTNERLKYFARKLRDKELDRQESAEQRQQVEDDPKLIELRAFAETIKYDGSYSDAERLQLSRAIRQRELGGDGERKVSEELYVSVKENQRARLGAEAEMVAAQAAQIKARLALLQERQDQLLASMQTQSGEATE